MIEQMNNLKRETQTIKKITDLGFKITIPEKKNTKVNATCWRWKQKRSYLNIDQYKLPIQNPEREKMKKNEQSLGDLAIDKGVQHICN